MISRLGNVLYWTASGLAGLTLLLGALLLLTEPAMQRAPAGPLTAFAIGAALLWLIGRACRYVLAGR